MDREEFYLRAGIPRVSPIPDLDETLTLELIQKSVETWGMLRWVNVYCL